MIPSDMPNAFATGRNPDDGKVAVTSGITQLLNRDEEERVARLMQMAHQMNSPSTVRS